LDGHATKELDRAHGSQQKKLIITFEDSILQIEYREVQTREYFRGDPKEVFEHAGPVQVTREKLRAACDAGSVRMTEFMAIEERGTVQHLTSRASGQLEQDRNTWNTFAELFSAVTVPGFRRLWHARSCAASAVSWSRKNLLRTAPKIAMKHGW
jgi:hypothetical protein